MNISPPTCPIYPHVIEKHSDRRVDNYYWLNEYGLKGKKQQKVLDYLKSENDYFDQVMKSSYPLKEEIYQEIRSRIKEDDEHVPFFFNGYWYMIRYEKGKEYPVYERKKQHMNAPTELLLNVNEIALGKSYCDVEGIYISPDNTTMIYGVDFVGRRQYELIVVGLYSGQQLASISNTEGYAVWSNDSDTFFFTTKDKRTLRSDTVMKYSIKQAKKQRVYQEGDEAFDLSISKSKDDKFIFIDVDSTNVSEVLYVDATYPTLPPKVFHPREENHLYSVDSMHDTFYILTNDGAPNFCLAKTSYDDTAKQAWVNCIPHDENILLEDMEIFDAFIVIEERQQAITQLRVIDIKDYHTYHYISQEESNYVVQLGQNLESKTPILRYTFQSMKTPLSVIDYDMVHRTKTILKTQTIVGGYEASAYETNLLWATAEDGTRIPISMVYKKDQFRRDGKMPLLLYGYGSYGISIDPTFSTSRLSLLDRGFIFAIAHIRGGQEMGRSWYEGGKMFQKQHTFSDFIACAEFLIREQYTSSHTLCAQGGSAGGLLIGTVINQRPDLWRAVIANVPFVDVVTTMLDDSIPLTTGEYDEWGNPNNKESYDYMKSYSPYDNVKAQAYPSMLVTTGLHDSQVQYFEPAKWVAKLRATKTDQNVLLLFTDMETGHGGPTGRFKAIDRVAMEYTFILRSVS